MQILNKNDGSVIYEKDVPTMKECVNSAITDGVGLINADLSTQDLDSCVFLRGNCTWADLSGATLTSANFDQCNLYEAVLTGADLTGADFTRANLQGVTLTAAQLGSLGSELTAHQMGQVTIVD